MLWINRTFEFNFPMDTYPDIIDRLRSMPDRVEELIQDVPVSMLKMRKEGKWSIQEHVGHLINTETLFRGRLDHFEAGVDVLRPADMTNRRTYEANHNLKRIETVLKAFKRERSKFIKYLEDYQPEMFCKTAHHPRLDKPMRLMDSLYFQAEHDDHHLATMKELVYKIKK